MDGRGGDVVRDVVGLVVARVGRVVEWPGQVPGWQVQDASGEPVMPVAQYLADFAAQDMSPASVRSYAQGLLRWFRLLWALEVPWDRATSAEVRDFVLWLRQARKHRPVEPQTFVPGTVNVKSGKRYLGDGYAPRTVNHNLSVVRAFYEFHLAAGRGPLRNPVPARRPRPGQERFAAHHNPLAPFPASPRGAYRQKEPRRQPRSLPDAAVEELFTALGCHRDRALMAFYLSSGARPGELLTVTNQLVDPGNQVVGVIRKGSRAVQSLPASPDAFVWLRLYQAELPAECLAPAAPVWWTRRRPRRPLGYGAARAVFIRVNAVLGTNWTLHDLRHTAATRMASDPGMPLVDIQHILGHAWLTTTQIYLHPHERDVLEHAHAHFERLRSRQREERTSPRPGELPGGQGAHLAYDAADLKELFGGDA